LDKNNSKLKKASGSTKLKKADDSTSRPKYLKYILLGLVAVIIVVAALAVYSSYSKGYVAKVGNEKIGVAEFNFFLKQQKDNMLAEAMAENPNMDADTFWNTKIDGEAAIEIAKKKALENARELKIQVIKAKEQKITLEKSDLEGLDSMIKQVIEQNDNSKTEANKFFRGVYGVSIDEFREIYKGFILRSKLYQKETEAMKLSEDQMPEYYEKYPDAFKDTDFRQNAEEAVWARHILIKSTSDMSAEEQEKAKKKAEDILARVKKGEDFATLAKENSDDAGSAPYGGDYIFGRGKMMQEFEDTAFELAPGQVSDLVKTDYGYHIIKVEEKIPKDQRVSLRAAKEYREFGLNAVKAAMYQEKLDQWKKDAKYNAVKNQAVYDSLK